MIILGIDPGSRKAGHAIIETIGRKTKYIASGVMRYDHVPEFIDRLGIIYESCSKIVDEYQPDEIAIESLIYVKNVTSLAKLAEARGAMIASFMRTHSKKVFEYSPNLIKTSVTGYGHATKESIQKGLGMIFGKRNFNGYDESDALAIALCHALNRGTNDRISTRRSHF